MRLTPQEPVIPEIGGFTGDNDIFGYRDFADRFANLVSNIDEPLVIALDGPWGSGKSIFAKQWAGLLRERGASVIYFDAFRSDYYEDAFLAISAEIHTAAKNTLGGNAGETRRYLNKAKKVGGILAPLTLRVAARASTAGLLSLEDVEAGGDALKATVKALGNESAKAIEKAISVRLRKASEERVALDAFRETLSEVAGALAEAQAEDDANFPLVFIVDELDRCRPPFALSVIERIKHLFSVQGVCFVLVTHLPQLATAVQGAYGVNFDAVTYLEKFYHVRMILPAGNNLRENQRAAYVDYLWEALGIAFFEQEIDQLVKGDLKALADAHDLSLRRLERVMSHIALASAAAGPRRILIAPLLAGLCVMRQTHPDLYMKARGRELSWDEADSFLQPAKGQGVRNEWSLEWWKYAARGALTQDRVNELARHIAQYGIRDSENLLPFMADYVDELVPQERLADDR